MELLNYEQIKAQKIFSSPTPDKINFTDVSVNLKAGNIITISQSDVDSFDIPPRGMVVVVSEEVFDMPMSVVGYTTVKNALSRKGIMAVNIGLVDNGFKGPISSILINFGREDFSIAKGDTFLRMTFHQFDAPAVPATQARKLTDFSNKAIYLKSVKQDIRGYLDPTFLALNDIKEQITNKVMKSIGVTFGWILGVVAILGFLFSIFFEFYDWKKQQDKFQYERVVSKLDSVTLAATARLDSAAKKSAETQQLITKLSSQLENLEKRIPPTKSNRKPTTE